MSEVKPLHLASGEAPPLERGMSLASIILVKVDIFLRNAQFQTPLLSKEGCPKGGVVCQ
jgi:hypothetical protein